MSDDNVTYDLFGAIPKPKRFEVHRHCVISGPHSNRGKDIVHSHEGGSKRHAHEHCGPATYTIDKDEWFAATGGVQGGGRKEYTDAPSGEQLPVVELEDWQNSFEIHYAEDPTGGMKDMTGGGHLAAARMVLAFRMSAVIVPFPGPKKASA